MDFNQFQNAPAEMPEKPDNNMTLSIVSTVLGMCSVWCIGLILGIIAIVLSSQSTSKYNNGEYDAAVKAAKNAKLLAFIAIGLFILTISYTIYKIIVVGGFAAYFLGFMEQIQAAQQM